MRAWLRLRCAVQCAARLLRLSAAPCGPDPAQRNGCAAPPNCPAALPPPSVPEPTDTPVCSLLPRPPSKREAIDAFYTGPSLVPQLRNSSSQILLMAGSQDRVVPPATHTQLAAQLIAAGLVQVPDAGHVRLL